MEFEKALPQPEAKLGIGRSWLAVGDPERTLRHFDDPACLDRVKIPVDRYEFLRHELGGGTAEENAASAALLESIERDAALILERARDNDAILYARAMLALSRGKYDVA